MSAFAFRAVFRAAEDALRAPRAGPDDHIILETSAPHMARTSRTSPDSIVATDKFVPLAPRWQRRLKSPPSLRRRLTVVAGGFSMEVGR